MIVFRANFSVWKGSFFLFPCLNVNFSSVSRLLDRGTEGDETTSSEGKIVAVQAAGGILAGATASCITTPLDTIKTRLQAWLKIS